MLVPLQAAGDHQVDHQEQLVLQREHDALAEPAQAEHLPALGRGDRRHGGAQQERVEQPDAQQAGAEDAALEALEVDGDVGKLGQAKRGEWDSVGTVPDDMIFR